MIPVLGSAGWSVNVAFSPVCKPTPEAEVLFLIVLCVALYRSKSYIPPVEVSITAGFEKSAELFFGIITEFTPKNEADRKQEPKFLVS